MRKLTALVAVLAWGAFWIFGSLAVLSPELSETLRFAAVLLAGAGFLLGMACFLRLRPGFGGRDRANRTGPA
ncbi:hypothetical protein KM176_22610 [Pseudooceanicola sp. CBS1P-1]|uniref:Uncharacterized protein n=1 Tax=Pseudooceanicola albus TaxID=2692189 RepID=A0A6L7GBI8_9RHOB|nr:MULTISPECIES: hypothetical protein [Pseudooceanicola]MBT9386661.1 hypothetical protein [Pseudooceanicola endophyticus]MXN20927.1 hypothetical protein [Pseudooceanicola albus]